MLESYNDAAVMIAEHIGGSVERFAAMMNEKAAGLGCGDTYFITPNGWMGSRRMNRERNISIPPQPLIWPGLCGTV